jgi:hypothetical protein
LKNSNKSVEKYTGLDSLNSIEDKEQTDTKSNNIDKNLNIKFNTIYKNNKYENEYSEGKILSIVSYQNTAYGF